MTTRTKSTRRVKAWALISEGSNHWGETLLREGWGSLNDCIFRTKWLAEDFLEENNLSEVKIVPCTITYQVPQKKAKRKTK